MEEHQQPFNKTQFLRMFKLNPAIETPQPKDEMVKTNITMTKRNGGVPRWSWGQPTPEKVEAAMFVLYFSGPVKYIKELVTVYTKQFEGHEQPPEQVECVTLQEIVIRD